MSRLICRDPFTRAELHSEVVSAGSATTCDYCGSQNGRPGKRTLFAYYTETDGGRTIRHRGLFCSKPCHDCYH